MLVALLIATNGLISWLATAAAAAAATDKQEATKCSDEDALYERWRLLYDSLFLAGKTRPFAGAEQGAHAADLLNELNAIAAKNKSLEVSAAERFEVEWWTKAMNRIVLLECSVEFERSIHERRKRLVESMFRELYYNDNNVPDDIKLDEYIVQLRNLMLKVCLKFRGNQLTIKLESVAEQVDHLRLLLNGSESLDDNDMYAQPSQDKRRVPDANEWFNATANIGQQVDARLSDEQRRVAIASRLRLFAGLRKCPVSSETKVSKKLHLGRSSAARKQFKKCYAETIMKPCGILEKVVETGSHLADFVGYLEWKRFVGAPALVRDWHQLRSLCRKELVDERVIRLAYEILRA